MAEMYAKYLKLCRKLDRTTDPVEREKIEGDINRLKESYREEVAFLRGM